MNIENILKMLDSSNNLSIQEQGIKLAKNTGYIREFILPLHPMYNKNIWNNCAKIISSKTDFQLLPYIIEILEWLQDLTWPGTFIIINRCMTFQGKMLVKPYEKLLRDAFRDEGYNNDWINHLSKLLENKQLSEELDTNLYNKMVKRYQFFWN